jgi:site-specific DNA-methyltransferase (adenine-specific)
MKEIPSSSVDMVLCDLPYGTTACKWDAVIPFEPLWAAYRRVCKPNAAIVLTASQPFTSALVLSNASAFRHEWIWEKSKASNFLLARKQPLKAHESALTFCYGTPPYYPQKTAGKPYSGEKRAGRKGSNSEVVNDVPNPQFRRGSADGTRFPRSVQYFATPESEGQTSHPTQKPVALMEYLIRTYTNSADVVLDNTMGSGTTGVACMNTGRNFIGIERDKGYFAIAKKRIQDAYECSYSCSV